VTSAVPGEGKTTVAVDLAHAIALSGRRVVLVELDLRRPTFAQHFPLSGGEGVTTALLGRRSAVELLQQPLRDAPDLWVLPAGPLPPNPAELLESAALDALLKELADEDVTLVLDAPPLVPVADAQVLLRQSHVDTALVVGRIDLTTRDQIRRARAILDRQRFEPLGLVVTGHHEDKRYAYEAYSPGEAPAARRASDGAVTRTGSAR
jgi:capsular exopolysaccharide synthesis family protein